MRHLARNLAAIIRIVNTRWN